MKNTIIDTWNCYMGYSNIEECYVGGSYSELSDSNEIEGDIEWDQHAWDCEKQYFMDYLESVIKAYEKRYKTSVTHIGMIGSVGTWRGNFAGGKIIDYGENPLEHMGDVDDIQVRINDDGTVTLYGFHHDSSHAFDLYLLTESKLQKWAPDMLQWGDYDHTDLQRIRDNSSPIKHITKEQKEYFNVA